MTASYFHLTFVSIQMNTQEYMMDEHHPSHAQAHLLCSQTLKLKPSSVL